MIVGCLWLSALTAARAGEPAAKTRTPAPAPKAAEATTETDELYRMGQQLFDQLAPPEVKAEYAFPTKEEWDAMAQKLQSALASDSLQDLAELAPQGRMLLTTLRSIGAESELADWLEQRLDEVEGAKEASAAVPPAPVPMPVPGPAPVPKPPAPSPKPPAPGAKTPASAPRIPHYDLWLARVRTRPVPDRAAEFMPMLRTAFATEGVPASLAWLAEAESSLNPNARSPSGARGLFQLMPDTAKNLGLGTFLPDERTHPEKSARAAARYLKQLHGKFGSWPLALAAYNAGEGRVARELAKRNATDFASIADRLPAETRMYVPKVCALVAVRSGTPVASL